MRHGVGHDMFVGRVHKGAELVDRCVKGVLKRFLVVDDSRVAASRHHALGQAVHKRVLALHAQRVVAPLRHLVHNHRDVVRIDRAAAVNPLGIKAVLARKRNVRIPTQIEQPIGHLVGRATRGDHARNSLLVKAVEHLLRRRRNPVRLKAQQRAVDIEKRGFDHSRLLLALELFACLEPRHL